MRVVVTGASGLLGSAVCDALLARGDEVVGLSRDPVKSRKGNPTVTWFEWQPVTHRPPPEALEGADAVVNLIGEPLEQRWTAAAKERIMASRATATRNLAQALVTAEQPPKTLVSQSAVGYYGDRGDALVDESTPGGDDFPATVCVAWEAAAHEAEADGLRLVITRTGLVLTPHGGLLKRLLPPFRIGVGGPLAGGQQYVPWIHIDDEVGILLWALGYDAVDGTINSMAPNPVTNREFSTTLGHVLHRPSTVPAPKLAIRAAFGRELAEAAAGGQRAIPRRALDLGYEFRFPELEPALRDLLES